MSWVISGILLVIIIVLYAKRPQQITINRREAEQYQKELEQLRNEKQKLAEDIKENSEALINDYQEKIFEIQAKYREALNKKTEDLNSYFENQKQFRQSEMDTDFERQERERKESLDQRMKIMVQQAQETVNKAEMDARAEIERWNKAKEDIAAETIFQEEKFESLLAPMRQYEMEQQERLFYTIQVPDEYKGDIDFLLNSVAPKVKHPDVINKLIWSEYVKPYIDSTFKRVGIEDKPGIYKLTSLINNKCYIGKSTNIKKRIADHIKSVVGISTIADQAVHHVIADEGYWNWTIEPIIYCEKEQLNELEKYYINFFKAQEYGYNKRDGG